MYLPEPDATKLLQEIAQGFNQSQLVLELIPEKYTKGFLHKVMRLAFRLLMGMDISFVFGVQEPRQIESYGKGLKVVDVKGHMPYIVTASIGES